jgi:glycosyltransferase involved in cell wall biosynthesis
LYVSRLSTRKGLELISALSHRLADLAGLVRIEIYGGATMWSDYTGMLDELNPAVATYGGQLAAAELVERYHSAHALLLPSRYEPFGLVVGEALATGMPVVVSREVGAGEAVHPSVCRRFDDPDLVSFESEVRGLLTDLDRDEVSIRSAAIAEAQRVFAPGKVGEDLQRLLQDCIVRFGRDHDGRCKALISQPRAHISQTTPEISMPSAARTQAGTGLSGDRQQG